MKKCIITMILIITMLLIGCSSKSNTTLETEHKDEFIALDVSTPEKSNEEEHQDNEDDKTLSDNENQNLSNEENSENLEEGLKQSEYVIENSGEIYNNYDKIKEENNYDDGKSTDEMLYEQYKSNYTEDTQLIDNLDIPIADSLNMSDSAYNKVKLEISAIAESNNYSDIEVEIEECNINANYVTYIVRYDNSVYYHISIDISSEQIMTMPDKYGSGPSIWEEIQSNK